MKNKVWFLIIFLFSFMQKSEGQGIEINGFEEISLSSESSIFKPRTGLGVNFLFNDNIKTGMAYQHFNDFYTDDDYWDSSTLEYYTHSILNIYEINVTLGNNHTEKNISYGIGLKPACQFFIGKNYISSNNIPWDGWDYDTLKVKKVRPYISGIVFLKFNNIFESNFSFEFNIQAGAVFLGIYPTINYLNPFGILTPFSRFNVGLIYNLRKQNLKNKIEKKSF